MLMMMAISLVGDGMVSLTCAVNNASVGENDGDGDGDGDGYGR